MGDEAGLGAIARSKPVGGKDVQVFETDGIILIEVADEDGSGGGYRRYERE